MDDFHSHVRYVRDENGTGSTESIRHMVGASHEKLVSTLSARGFHPHRDSYASRV